MKRFLPLMVVLCCPVFALSQDISGLWKGTLYNDSTNQSLDYEVVISKSKGKYSAYSHTWYLIDNQRYYGIKKLNVRIAKNGKIVMQDASLKENNYPIRIHKDAVQLNVLDFTTDNNEATLNGIFVTNATTGHKALTGRIAVTRVNPLLVQSDLMPFMQKNGADASITVVK